MTIDVTRANGRAGDRSHRRRDRRRGRRRGRAPRTARPRRGARRPPRSTALRRRHAGHGGDPMRVILADDAVVIREGLARLLAEHGIDVTARPAPPTELLRLVAADPPDVAVVDIRMPPTYTNEGLLAAQEIRRAYPQVGDRRPLAVRRGRIRAEARQRHVRRRRLPAQGPDRRRRRVRGRAASGSPTEERSSSLARQRAPRRACRARSAGRAHGARAGSARADRAGQDRPRHRPRSSS